MVCNTKKDSFDYSNTDKSTMKTFEELLYQKKERRKKMLNFLVESRRKEL
jgi:hypothetical protein